eukprot:IDg21128t1
MAYEFCKYPKALQFKNVASLQRKHGSEAVTYGPKIKLHGTNAAVRISTTGKVTAQSRNRDSSETRDNCGFVAWVAPNVDTWRAHTMRDRGSIERAVVIFGEWAGRKIHNNGNVQAVTSCETHAFSYSELLPRVG